MKPTVTATKISDTTIAITTQPIMPEPITTNYDRAFINQQIINIQVQKDRDDALRDAELQNCQDILAQMDSLGIVTKLQPPIMEPPIKITS